MALQMILDNMRNPIFFDAFLAIALLLLGIFLGKLIASLLSKIAKVIDIEKRIRPSFVKLIITVIKWSVYIIFINLALNQFTIDGLSSVVVDMLVVVPALTTALVLIGIGFAIAVYLREVIEDSNVSRCEVLSEYIYYFVLYVFGVYSLNLALISIDPLVKNILIIVFTVIIVGATAFSKVKNEFKNN